MNVNVTPRQMSAWGRLSADVHNVVQPSHNADLRAALCQPGKPALAIGLQRSYGDVCLNAGGRLLRTTQLDRFVEADWNIGVVLVEAGLTIDQLLQVAVPKGWFIPVSPGTKFVTLGGAIANDIHGKNHHAAGTIGRYVRKMILVRSNGDTIEITPAKEPDLFAATIGGLGLTGVIARVELSLVRIASAYLDVETVPVANIDDFFQINAESVAWPYTVAWVDCFARGADIGRGLYMRGRPSAHGSLALHGNQKISVPIDAPSILLNSFSMRGFNAVYRRFSRKGELRQHYDSFFYPLDSIGAWNRLYGPRGFYQFQCVVPIGNGRDLVRRMLSEAANARQGSFLIVLKTFGDLESPGMLSFPRPGITLALDFPNKGDITRRLLDRLNAMTAEAGGRIYPAKDATMTGDQFRTAYPRWENVEHMRDPGIISDFWRRVTGIAV